MKFDITKSGEKPSSFKVESVISQFTLEETKLERRFRGSIDIEGEDWPVGVIVGRTGTGKTTIAKQLFPEAYIRGFAYKEASFFDDFPEKLGTADITRALSSVGFSSPPEWLKSYEQLSQGEKMRVDIARALLLEEHFKQHHYLSNEIPCIVDCYAAVYKGSPIGFIVVTHGVGKTRYFRISRVVTIPDYQGIGFAKAPSHYRGTLHVS